MVNNLSIAIADLRDELYQEPVVCFTSDIDWASEYAIGKSLQYFHSAGIPLTAFLTHKSETLAKDLEAGNIFAGIHPNFFHGSSHGDSYDEVIDFCLGLLPNANCFRAHRYYEVNDTYAKLFDKGIRFCSNICTFLEDIPPFLHRSGMVQFPIFFEDGAYLLHNGSLSFKDTAHKFCTKGLKIINIHPMHLMLNTPNFAYTRKIKDTVTKEEWNSFDENTIAQIRNTGTGISDYLDEMIEFIKKEDIRMIGFNELISRFDDVKD